MKRQTQSGSNSLCWIDSSTDDVHFDVESWKSYSILCLEDKGHYVTVADKKYSVYFWIVSARKVYFYVSSMNCGLVYNSSRYLVLFR